VASSTASATCPAHPTLRCTSPTPKFAFVVVGGVECVGNRASRLLPLKQLVEDVSFHPCVRLSVFDRDRVVSFVPPDGDFKVSPAVNRLRFLFL
jgi:hypothetical protein